MKNKILPVFIFMILAISFRGHADSPDETYFLERKQIPDSFLREAQAVLTLAILDPKAYAAYYQKTEVKSKPYISVFQKGKNGFAKLGLLNETEIMTPTGGEYGPAKWYRFPVIGGRETYLEIIYNLPENKRCWVNLAELEHSLSGEKPVLEWFTTRHASKKHVSVDIFYLARNNEITLCNGPGLKYPCRTATPRSEIVQSHGTYDAAAFILLERRNGFGRLGKSRGADSPPMPIGWIRLRDENGLLMVWPIISPGC